MLKLVVIALATVAVRATDDDSRAAATTGVYQKDKVSPAVGDHIQRLSLDIEREATVLASCPSPENLAQWNELINKGKARDKAEQLLGLHNAKDLSYDQVKEKCMLRLNAGDLLAENRFYLECFAGLEPPVAFCDCESCGNVGQGSKCLAGDDPNIFMATSLVSWSYIFGKCAVDENHLLFLKDVEVKTVFFKPANYPTTGEKRFYRQSSKLFCDSLKDAKTAQKYRMAPVAARGKFLGAYGLLEKKVTTERATGSGYWTKLPPSAGYYEGQEIIGHTVAELEEAKTKGEFGEVEIVGSVGLRRELKKLKELTKYYVWHLSGPSANDDRKMAGVNSWGGSSDRKVLASSWFEGRLDREQYQRALDELETLMPAAQILNTRFIAKRHLNNLRIPLSDEELRRAGVPVSIPQRDVRDVPNHCLGDLGWHAMGTGALAKSAILDHVPKHVATFDKALGVRSVDDMKNMHYDEYINGLHVDVVDGALTGDFTMITGSLALARQMSGPTVADEYVFPYQAAPEEEEGDEKLDYIIKMTNELSEKLNKLFFGDAAATADGADAETEV